MKDHHLHRSLIVYGPSGCGKTHNAAKISTHFGLERIIDDGDSVDISVMQRAMFEKPTLVLVGGHGENALWYSKYGSFALVSSFDAVMQIIAKNNADEALDAVDTMLGLLAA